MTTKKRASGSPPDAHVNGPNQDLPCMSLRVFRRRLEARPAESNPVGPLQVPVCESQPNNWTARVALGLIAAGALMGKISPAFSLRYHSLRPATRLLAQI